MIQPTKEKYLIIKNMHDFSKGTFHSFNNIINPTSEKLIIFCCSSISPLNYKGQCCKLQDSSDSDSNSNSNSHSNSKGSTEISEKKNLNKIRIKKRENLEYCPMKIKFIFDESTQEFEICPSSNFLHNHSAISDNNEVKN
jgi:hypothetical protein